MLLDSFIDIYSRCADAVVNCLFQLVRPEERVPKESFRSYQETNSGHSQPDKRPGHEDMGRKHVSNPDSQIVPF